jgi:hypothetical protein
MKEFQTAHDLENCHLYWNRLEGLKNQVEKFLNNTNVCPDVRTYEKPPNNDDVLCPPAAKSRFNRNIKNIENSTTTP